MFKFKQVLFTIAASIAVVKAHFNLTYPPTRGFVEDTETQAPCGGFNSVGPRSTFPLGDAYVVLDSEHATATITVLISFKQNPTTFADWTNSTTGQSQPALRDFFQTTGSAICIGVNVQSRNYAEAKDGANATILVQYSGGDGDLFQCTDVTLSNSFTIPSNVTCTNKIAASSTTSTAPGSSQTAKSGTAPGTTVWGGFTLAPLLVLGALAFA